MLLRCDGRFKSSREMDMTGRMRLSTSGPTLGGELNGEEIDCDRDAGDSR